MRSPSGQNKKKHESTCRSKYANTTEACVDLNTLSQRSVRRSKYAITMEACVDLNTLSQRKRA